MNAWREEERRQTLRDERNGGEMMFKTSNYGNEHTFISYELLLLVHAQSVEHRIHIQLKCFTRKHTQSDGALR